MNFTIRLFGHELLAVSSEPAGEIEDDDVATSATSSIEFGFAPTVESYWGEDQHCG